MLHLCGKYLINQKHKYDKMKRMAEKTTLIWQNGRKLNRSHKTKNMGDNKLI